MAAGAICPINANDDNMVVANERDKDNTNTGELVSNIFGSRPETPTRRSHLPLPPSGALLGVAAGGKGGLSPTGDGQATKELNKVSAQHDDVIHPAAGPAYASEVPTPPPMTRELLFR